MASSSHAAYVNGRTMAPFINYTGGINGGGGGGGFKTNYNKKGDFQKYWSDEGGS